MVLIIYIPKGILMQLYIFLKGTLTSPRGEIGRNLLQ